MSEYMGRALDNLGLGGRGEYYDEYYGDEYGYNGRVRPTGYGRYGYGREQWAYGTDYRPTMTSRAQEMQTSQADSENVFSWATKSPKDKGRPDTAAAKHAYIASRFNAYSPGDGPYGYGPRAYDRYDRYDRNDRYDRYDSYDRGRGRGRHDMRNGRDESLNVGTSIGRGWGPRGRYEDRGWRGERGFDDQYDRYDRYGPSHGYDEMRSRREPFDDEYDDMRY